MKLYKLLLSAAVTATAMGVTSCGYDYDYPPVVCPDLGGDGSAEGPLTVDGVTAYYNAFYSSKPDETTYYWATGYIVGCVETTETVFTATDETVNMTAPFSSASNLLLAASPDETDYTKCISLQLPSGDVRSSLNLKDNPGNLSRQVTVHGYIDKYIGLAGMRSVNAYNWGDQGIPGMDPVVAEYTLANSITSGKAYAMVAMSGANGSIAVPQGESYSYGYLYVESVTPADGKFNSDEANSFTFTETGDGYYYITDCYGKYLYMSGTFSSFQLSPTRISGDNTFKWEATANADGTWTITNVGNGKTIAYSVSHTSYGAYSSLGDDYLLPTLFEKEGEPVTPPGGETDGPSGGDDDTPSGNLTFARASSVTAGRQYVFVNADGKVGTPIQESYSYGYIYAEDPAESTSTTVTTAAANAFTIEAAAGGYAIKDTYGRYYGMTGTYTSFQILSSASDEGAAWTFDLQSDGTFLITNLSKGNFVIWNSQYNNFAPQSTEGATLPYLYEKVD